MRGKGAAGRGCGQGRESGDGYGGMVDDCTDAERGARANAMSIDRERTNKKPNWI